MPLSPGRQQCLDGMTEKALSTVATVAGYDNQPERAARPPRCELPGGGN
jgi:hypothetical protein